jgi:antitoxin CptB
MDRLRWRCRRGMLELDLLLQGFLDRGYTQLDDAQKGSFTRLLELPDQTLSEYLLGTMEIEEREFVDVIERIRHAAAP